MRIIKEADFRKEIKSSPQCGYLFFGEEDYLKGFCIDTARAAICPDPSFAFFNEMKLDALDFSAQKLLDALMPLPMMSEKKLITVSGLNFLSMKPTDMEDLCEVLAELSSLDYNVLIINVASDCFDPGLLLKKPSEAMTRLCEHLTAVHFERSTPAKLAAWAQKHFAHNGVEASPLLCSKMLDYCGHSMYTLANEIDKLSFYTRAHERTEATEADMQTVCIPTIEYDVFAFTNAIKDGQRTKALDILADYRFRRVDPILILSEVVRVIYEMVQVHAMTSEGHPNKEISSVTGIHEYKVGLYQKSLRGTTSERLKSTLNAALAADASLKLSAQGYTVLERLICTL